MGIKDLKAILNENLIEQMEKLRRLENKLFKSASERDVEDSFSFDSGRVKEVRESINMLKAAIGLAKGIE